MFKLIFLKHIFWILIEISIDCLLKDPDNRESTLVHVMPRRLFGAKPLPEPMMIQFTDENLYHQGPDSI